MPEKQLIKIVVEIFNQFHKSITQSNFEEFNIIKNNIYGVRKSSKYKTPIYLSI